MTDFSASNADLSEFQILGRYGEQLVGQWLVTKNCRLLHHNWHSRFGEIDLIATGPSGEGAMRTNVLAFVEVKTRSQGNWDADGLLAVTRTKQKKIRLTARYFLVRHPHLSEMPCRFDIALVGCQKAAPRKGLSLALPGDRGHLFLQDYIRDAFC
ncbi:MAG: YraN family protein [Cyanobacteria bacterium J06621_3]